jgi:hypothetical protein
MVSLRPPPQSAIPPGMGPSEQAGEVLAATQLGVSQAAGAPAKLDRTDLGAARDTTLGGQAPRKKGPPLWLIFAPIALVLTALGGAFVIVGRRAATAHDPSPTPSASVVAPRTSADVPAPPTSADVPAPPTSADVPTPPTSANVPTPLLVPSAPPSARPKPPHNPSPPTPGGCVDQPGKPCIRG